MHNYLVFHPVQRYFKRIDGAANGNCIFNWESKGLSDERINSIKTSDYGINSYLSYQDTIKISLKFDGGCLKQDPGSLFHWGIENVYIVYQISKKINISDYLTPGNCLFGAVKLTKNVDIAKYGYSDYGIGFDRHGYISFPGTGVDRNVIIFGVDTSSSTKIDNRKK